MVTAQPNLSSALATQRIYYLSVQTRAEGFADSLELLGAFSPEPRTLEQVQRSLKKARSGEYEILMLSPSLFSHPRRKEIVDLCRQSEMQVVLQFTPEQTELVKELLSGNTSDLSCQLVITHQAESILELNLPPPVFLSLALILVTRSLDVFSAVDQVIKRGLDPFIYFPYERQNLEFYSVKEIHQLISHLKLQFPSVNLRHHRGLDVYEPEIDPLRQNEPLIEPQISYRSSNPDIQISVIIPSYNNVKYLSATVRHLLYQTLSDDQFEIIIVDDGSNDGTMEVIRAQVDKCPRKLNFKYIYFPRPQSRQMGDSQFRAGIARNLGVKHAEGQWLAFLDSDILVSPNYLRRLLEQHRHFDVIQGKRLELTAKASSAMTEYQQIDPARDTYAVDHGYWLKFYENATVWNSVPAGWKYTCTHSLSLPTKLFKKVGWFRKTFIRYGFEDTDLGWRLWSDGARFKLNDEFVFHLYHATERSEFRNSHRDKMALLSKSAPTLYLNSLNPEVYREFEYLFNDSWDHRIYLKKKRANLPQPKSRQPGPPIELFFSPLGKKCDHQCHYCDSLSFKGLKTKNSLEPKAVPCNFLSLE